ncbi:MAG: hypothetical protein BGO20_17315 [Bosea sp. 67-29]|nr:MAG: hypothetical protein BGO20_17315 [Bosea sp. 67-29]
MRQFAKHLSALNRHQAIVMVPPPSEKDEWTVVTTAEIDQHRGAIARSRKFFPAKSGPALLMIDFDTRAYPPSLREKIGSAGNLSAVLKAIFPDFAHAASLTRNSTSSGIHCPSTGETTNDSGQHRYFVVADGLDASDFATRLHQRLILKGYGFGIIRKTGHVDICSLIDEGASAPERIVYEADADLGAGLQQSQAARTSQIKDGFLLDTRSLPPLSPEETQRFVAECNEIRNALRGEAAAQRAVWLEERVRERVAKGEPEERVRQSLTDAVDRRELCGSSIEIQLDDGSTVTPNKILADLSAFHGKTCADPLEPEYGGGRNLAIIYTKGHSRPIIHSHAHGGIQYVLTPDPLIWFEDLGDEPSRPASDPSWPEPADIFGDAGTIGLGDFPLDCLSPQLAAWVGSQARRKGVPTAFAGAGALTTISAAVGASLRIRPHQKDDWEEPAGLWTVLIAEPGSGKSPTISAALAPLRDLDNRHGNEDRAAHAEWTRRQAKRHRKDAPDQPLERVPRIRRYVLDSVTAEKLVRIMADNPRGIMRAPDEWASFLGEMGAYKRDAGGDRAMMLRTFDGGSIDIERMGSGNTHAACGLQSILAGSQPDKIQRALANLAEDGMAQRTLFILDDDIRRVSIDEEPDKEAERAYRSTIQTLAAASYIFDDPVRLTPEGYDASKRALEQITLIGRFPGSPAAFAGHLAKWGRLLPRVILAIHSFEECEALGYVDASKPVPLERVQRCIRIAMFLVRHQFAFYSQYLVPDEKDAEARWLAGFMLTRPGVDRFSHKTIYDARTELRGADERDRRRRAGIMDRLVDAGWCRVEKHKDGLPDTWLVNPRVYERFAQRAEHERTERAARLVEIEQAAAARRNLINQDNSSKMGVQT